jgi:hypothetical protein
MESHPATKETHQTIKVMAHAGCRLTRDTLLKAAPDSACRRVIVMLDANTFATEGGTVELANHSDRRIIGRNVE